MSRIQRLCFILTCIVTVGILETPTVHALSILKEVSPDTSEHMELVASYANSASNGDPAPARGGLGDSSGYVRAGSADILAQYGDLSDVALIESTAQGESNASIKDALMKSHTKLEYRLAEDKPAYVDSRLQNYASMELFPISSFYFLLDKAEDLGVGASSLEAIKDKDGMESLKDDIDQALTIISFSGNLSGALNSTDPKVKEWAIERVAKEKSLSLQDLANQTLIQYMKTGQGRDAMLLLEAMNQHEVVRAENPDPSFERGEHTPPEGWKILIVDSEDNTVLHPTGMEGPEGTHSFARDLEIKNPSGRTVVQSDWFPLEDLKQNMLGGYRFEFGLFYRSAFKRSLTQAEMESGPVLTFKAEVMQDNGEKMEKEMAVPTSELYRFNWTDIEDRISVDLPQVSQARFTITVQGPTDLFMDDVFIRRVDEAFTNSPPETAEISVNPNVLVLDSEEVAGTTHMVHLSANVTDEDGDVVSGQWSSSIQGELGEGTQKDVIITKPGEHNLFFTPTDSAGWEGSKKITALKVLRPMPDLASTATEEQPVSGPVAFHLDLNLPSGVTAAGTLSINDARAASLPSIPGDVTVDTTQYPNGLASAECTIEVQNGGGAGAAILKSNTWLFRIENPED